MPEKGKRQSPDVLRTDKLFAGQITSEQITIEGFVALLADRIQTLHSCTEASTDLLDTCFQRGWLEPADLSERKLPLEKRRAARIVHAFLRRELGEADEEDFGAAAGLSDLYDCRVCVNHVAQVYVKGILQAAGNVSGQGAGDADLVFGMQQLVSQEEAERVIARIFDKEKRCPVKGEAESTGSVVLTAGEAVRKWKATAGAVLIDVRTEAQYAAGHLQGAKNIPMSEVLKNPYRAAPDIHTPVFFYCTEGAQSTIAANCATDAGFTQVYAFGIDCDGDAAARAPADI